MMEFAFHGKLIWLTFEEQIEEEKDKIGREGGGGEDAVECTGPVSLEVEKRGWILEAGLTDETL